jgi:hypothetical protein
MNETAYQFYRLVAFVEPWMLLVASLLVVSTTLFLAIWTRAAGRYWLLGSLAVLVLYSFANHLYYTLVPLGEGIGQYAFIVWEFVYAIVILLAAIGYARLAWFAFRKLRSP